MSGKRILNLVEREKLREREQQNPGKAVPGARTKIPPQLLDSPVRYLSRSRPHPLAEGAD
jgi:hypothetical protein